MFRVHNCPQNSGTISCKFHSFRQEHHRNTWSNCHSNNGSHTNVFAILEMQTFKNKITLLFSFFFWMVSLKMCSNSVPRWCFKITRFTGIRLVLWVTSQHVHFQIVGGSGFILAHITTKRFVASMGSHVPFQCGRTAGLILTLLTAERLVSSMRSHMSFQIGRCSRSVVTYFTGKWFYTGMCSLVIC